MHIESTLTEIAIVVTAALLGGIVLERCKQPPILGYILAGILLGPSLLGLVTERETVTVLAELGVLMLLFVLGLELSLRSFVKLWHVSLGCVALQVVGGLVATVTLAQFFDWPISLTILLACVFALSSTAVAIKMMDSIDELRTDTGRLAVGVLIAQDLAIVPMTLIIRGLADGGEVNNLLLIFKIAVSVGLLAFLVFYFSRRERIRIPFINAAADNHELAPLIGLMFCFGASTIAGLVGLSAAYGAFIAGLVLGNSQNRHVMLEKMTPIYSVLMMVFFLSVGLLFDLHFIWENLLSVSVILLFLTVGKTLLNISIFHMFRQPWQLSFKAGVILSQIGEFSFLLSAVGIEIGVVDEYTSKMIISLTALSLSLSPLWFAMARRLQGRGLSSASFSELLNRACGQELAAMGRFFKNLATSKKDDA